MRQIFQRFSPLTAKILILAQTMAEQHGCLVDSASIILALISDIKTLAGDLLKTHGATFDRLIEIFAKASLNELKNKNQKFEVKNFLQTAAKVAFQNKSVYLEPEHLLLAILSDGNSAGVRLLELSGIKTLPILLQLKEFIFDLAETQTIDNLITELFENDQSSRSVKPRALQAFAKNLTLLAEQKKLDPVFCREEEINTLCQILCRRLKNNAVIVGEPGVGKTALVEALAQSIIKKQVPEPLINKTIYSLDLGRLVAGTTYRGQFEERMTNIIEEAENFGNIIIFIDELHTMTGAGSAEGSLDVAQILKPSLAAGNFSIIGATTFEEYRRHIEKDRALSRRFLPLILSEPSKNETIQILKKLKKSFENHHRVSISDQIVEEAVNLAEINLPDKFFPDKAIDLIDQAGAKSQPMYQGQSEVDKIKQDIFEIIQQKLIAIDQSNYSVARELKAVENKLETKLALAEKKCVLKRPKTHITIAHLQEIILQYTGAPVIQGSPQNLTKMPIANPYQIFKKYIFGQNQALKIISDQLRSIHYASANHKPSMSLIFVGPTGVGKTETARTVARHIFGSESRLIKFDMSEYSEKFSVSSLIGSPAGYVGFEEGGKLTNAVRKNPFSVILFDEIEKAHPDIFNLLLQILEDGFLTDNVGRKASFQNTVIILTSNIGNDTLFTLESIGFKPKNAKDQNHKKEIKNYYREQLLDFLSIELLGRISDIVVFEPLSQNACLRIFTQELSGLLNIFNQSNIQINIENKPKIIKLLAQKYNPKEGARSIIKIVNRELKQKIIDHLDKNPNIHIIKVTGDQKIILKNS